MIKIMTILGFHHFLYLRLLIYKLPVLEMSQLRSQRSVKSLTALGSNPDIVEPATGKRIWKLSSTEVFSGTPFVVPPLIMRLGHRIIHITSN